MTKQTWADKLKKWRREHSESYAKTILDRPGEITLAKLIPVPGVILIMGARRMGKTGEAHSIALDLHRRRGMPAVIHLPGASEKMRRKIQGRVPNWMKVVSSVSQWPKKCVVIYDEAAQSAHARRTQSGDAVDLDNLIGISGQRDQLIIFISHHSRKLDCNVVHEVNQIHWKQPTYAHQLFERDELSDFSMKAYDFFQSIRQGKLWRECSATLQRQIKKTTLVLDMDDFRFFTFTNTLPEHWSEDLSKLFQDITDIKPKKQDHGVKAFK